MRRASWQEFVLRPKFPLGTSRGIITDRIVWFLKIWDDSRPNIIGIGEAAPLPGLSLEGANAVRDELDELCKKAADWKERAEVMKALPSVRFAIEVALRDLDMGGRRMLYPSEFTLGKRSIPINGLIWMGDRSEMLQRIQQQLDAGIACLKMKIGAIAWEDELELLRAIRKEHPVEELELRVDANGGFSLQSVGAILQELADLKIHSIEQPIAPGRFELMAELCASSPLPIALDEDLIGAQFKDAKIALLDAIKPQYIVLKPSLVGGFESTKEWIDLAEQRGIGSWITSALESNIGLNAIAQWTFILNSSMTQGLGTGSLFHNNIPSPLLAKKGELWYRPELPWMLDKMLT